MELKTGYKQTEIGVIPQDWEIMNLGNLFEFKNGLNKEKHFFGYGTPIVNYMDVFNYSGIVSKDIKGKVFLTNPEIKTYEVRKGDVFFTRTSETVEEIGITTVVLENVIDTVFSGFVLRGRPKNSILDLSFKKYCFSSNFVRKEIISTASYTTRALTNGRLLANVKIVVPTLAEQTAIATALSDADGLITGLEKLIAKKRNIKQGTMQQLLQPKDGWEVKKLGECAFITKLAGFEYSLHFNSYKDEGEIIVIRGTNITNNKLDLRDIKTIPTATSKKLPRSKLSKNDLVFAYVGTIGPIYLVEEDDIFHLGPNTCKITVNKGIDSKYVYHYFTSENIKKEITEHTSIGAQPSLSMSKIRSFNIPLPNYNEQIRIATILSDMDSELSALEQKLEKFKKIKLGMMQELLTGKTRLV